MRTKEDIFDETLADFRSYLKLERALSANTIAGYGKDCEKLSAFLRKKGVTAPENARLEDLASFLEEAYNEGISKRSQARLTSSVKAFYRFLDAEGRLTDNPCDKLEAPKINPYLPTVLSVEEVFAILDSVDLSRPEGQRD
ncbi:MAG: site-specific integrase, partial [Bacteroidales bacterium]|nr:site-specific integrase [Bacteroidales bacterium]